MEARRGQVSQSVSAACFPTIYIFYCSSHWTLAPIMYPPHVVALACLYVAAHLNTFEQHPSGSPDFEANSRIASTLKKHGDWEADYQAQVEDLEGECAIKYSALGLRSH